MPGHSITFHGTAQLDTAQKKFGTASLLLDGNSDYLTVEDSLDDFHPPMYWRSDSTVFPQEQELYTGGIMVVECFVRWATLPATNGTAQAIWGSNVEVSGNSDRCTLGYVYKDTSGDLCLGFTHVASNDSSAGDYVIYKATSLAVDTWYYIVWFIGSGSAVQTGMFLDGTALETLSISNQNASGQVFNYGYGLTKKDFTIGVWMNAGTPTDYMNGWIDEFRVSYQGQRNTRVDASTPFIDPYIYDTPDWGIQHIAPLDATSTTTLTVPTSEYSNDRFTRLLLHFNGSDGATSTSDSSAAVPRPRAVRHH